MRHILNFVGMKILPSTYFPPLELMYHLIGQEDAIIEAHENYIKQSYRNRCSILSSNGALDLTVPVLNAGNKTLISEKRISYAENWQIKHWRAIESAYKNSPYFEYFEENIKKTLFRQEEFLFMLNKNLIQCVLDILRLEIDLKTTTHFEDITDNGDLRLSIDPKIKSNLIFSEYYQVFKEKTGFVPNLSILDLLFNEGLESISYLRNGVKPIAGQGF